MPIVGNKPVAAGGKIKYIGTALTRVAANCQRINDVEGTKLRAYTGGTTLNPLKEIGLWLASTLIVLATLNPAYGAQVSDTAGATTGTTGTTGSSSGPLGAQTGAQAGVQAGVPTGAQTGVQTGNAASPASAPPKSTTLQGGVNHAEELPGLDDALQVGKVYSDDLLLKSGTQSNNDWYYIPKWYAGVRHADDAFIVYRYNYVTGKSSTPMQKQLNRQDARAGYQRDRNGGIWDYKHVPAIQHVESDFCNAILYLRNVTPVSGSDDRLVVKYDEVSISLDKITNKILLVLQQEQINTITSPLPGVLRADVSTKAFGWDGKPTRQEQSVIISNIIKPFEPIDQFEGKDLRPLFRDYLVSHHLENLIPTGLAKTSP
jgi:hypothetical protein